MENKEIKYYNALNLITEIGANRFKKLLAYFPSAKLAWEASASELKKAGLEENIINTLIEKRSGISPDKELEKVIRAGIEIVTLKDSKYPKLLKEIYDSPALLYVKGDLLRLEDEFCLAVVGTRKLSSYGRQVTSVITRDLAQAGLSITSGLALGIDALAHKAALEAQGKTIAVLGCGLDRVYPVANQKLAQDMLTKRGAIVSEFPLGTPPLKHHFPFRNRIISGLSLGVLVIEAAEISGALITARSALEQNREVFAVPGNIYSPTSVGPNNLIKMGAKLVTSAQDILEELNLTKAYQFIETKKIVPDTKEEAKILEALGSEPIHIDDLVKATELPTSTVSSTLTMMEMKGKVKNLGGMQYVIAR